MELSPERGRTARRIARSATELNDLRSVVLGLGIDFAARAVDACQLGVERVARVAPAGVSSPSGTVRPLSASSSSAQRGTRRQLPRRITGRPSRPPVVLVATSEGVGERPPDPQHLARFFDRVQQRRLVRGQRFELPNSAHGASYFDLKKSW